MIKLDISNYLGSYAHLNGTRSMAVTPVSMARALVTVGRSSWGDTFHVGIFRISELICKALAFLEIKNGNLVLQERFYDLNQSEKATVSYYFGQALTKLYAEKYFDVKWLLHVDDLAAQIQFNIKGSVPPKIEIAKSKKVADRADLIGIEKKNIAHIFEAKGNSGGYDKSTMQHAINQVSQIKHYNGKPVETRAACYFNLSTDPIEGIVIDPEGDQDGIEVTLEELPSLEYYYKFFIENRQAFTGRFTFRDNIYLTTPVGVPSIFLASTNEYRK